MRPAYMAMALVLAAAFPSGAASAARYTIAIRDMQFGPAPKHLRVGDEITWKNEDIFRHTATARDGAFDLTLDPGASATITLRKAGDVAVYCRYHPGMTVRLSVGK